MPRLLLTLVLLAGTAGVASAQHTFEIVGTRALGMAGAFVAVADDSTAVYWNPAGLPVGHAVGATIGFDQFQLGNRSLPPVPGARAQSGRMTSLGGWPLGLSYIRLQTSTLRVGSGGVLLGDTLATSQFGVTLVQSLTERIILGSTLKYVRGRFTSANATGNTIGEALDAAADLDSDSSGAFDLDLGVMANLEKLRLGFTWKNLREPSFTDIAGTVNGLPRYARFGVALLPTPGLTLAMDLDLDTVDLRDGLRRMIALGGESRAGSRLTVRGGVRWSLEGASRQVISVGASVALHRVLWADGYYAFASKDDASRGFGVALRASY